MEMYMRRSETIRFSTSGIYLVNTIHDVVGLCLIHDEHLVTDDSTIADALNTIAVS